MSAVARLPGIKIAQIGMRGVANNEQGLNLSRKYGATVITSEQIHRNGIQPALAAIPQSENIYVSLDIDVLDPALAPGTGTVEVGGLTFQQLSDMLRAGSVQRPRRRHGRCGSELLLRSNWSDSADCSEIDH